MAAMQEDQLRAITDSEMRLAVGYWSGKLANQRQKAMVYYLAEPKLDLAPPEVDGRSSVVSPVVRNTIEAMMPALMVKFAGTDTVVEFEAQKPGDEQAAEQATDYINHLFFTKNSGELIAYNWMKDALLQKNGIVKVWWDTRSEETREDYIGLSDVELAQLMDDEEITVTEQKTYPDEEDAEQRQQAIAQLQQQLAQAQQAAAQNPQARQAAAQIFAQLQNIEQMPPKILFDVVCKRVKAGGKVCVENVPPEEFLISRKAKSIDTATFVGHRVLRTMSELRSMGYRNVDDITSDDAAASLNMERIERLAFDDEMAYLNNDQADNLDDSQRQVWVTECYIRVDYDGDGIAELRKVVRAGNQILENEICDIAPFVSITPVPMPHKFFGLSVADLAEEGQRISTMMLRGVLDNTYLQINGRYFAVEGQVNLDDLLTSRPGGVVRMKQQGMAGRLDQGAGDSNLGMGMLEYMKGFTEDATGWSRNSAGTDVNALNSQVTATQASIVTNKADMRLDLIARNFAEGYRDLFRMMLKLCSQYHQKEEIINLRGNWVPMNPREWRNGFSARINVGIGTGNKDQQVAHLNVLINQQAHGLQIGTANPQNVFEAQKELAKALGFKSGDKFFTDPAKMPPRPNPQIEAEKAKMQQEAQLAQMKLQFSNQLEQAKMQQAAQLDELKRAHELNLEQAKMRMQAEVDNNRQAAETAQKTAEMQQEAQLEQLKSQMEEERHSRDRDFNQWKAQLDAETKILVAQIGANKGAETAVIADAEQDAVEMVEEKPDTNAALAIAIQGLSEQLGNMNRPKTIIRGPDGRVTGVA